MKETTFVIYSPTTTICRSILKKTRECAHNDVTFHIFADMTSQADRMLSLQHMVSGMSPQTMMAAAAHNSILAAAQQQAAGRRTFHKFDVSMLIEEFLSLFLRYLKMT